MARGSAGPAAGRGSVAVVLVARWLLVTLSLLGVVMRGVCRAWSGRA
ncbi:MAG: hypothetical protein ABSA53_23865 [Streptosporangiaceae bacterium]